MILRANVNGLKSEIETKKQANKQKGNTHAQKEKHSMKYKKLILKNCFLSTHLNN